MLDLISIFKVAQKKGNSILLGWCKDIVNHFWFSCREANTYEVFVVSYLPIIFLRRVSLSQKCHFILNNQYMYAWWTNFKTLRYIIHLCLLNLLITYGEVFSTILQYTWVGYTTWGCKPLFAWESWWRGEKKVWLSPTKDVHVLKDLATVVLDKRLLNYVGYLLNLQVNLG